MQQELNKIDLAYIAGIVDGEGYVGIGRNNRTGRPNQVPQYMEVVSIGMNNPKPIKFIYRFFGGCFKRDTRGLYRVRLNNKLAHELLRQIRPFLKVKDVECKILFKLRKSIESPNTKIRSKISPRARILKKEVTNYRKSLFEEVKRLHHK